jgi:dTDP-4-dehydrorhamnose 3,5-epimerase
MEDERGALMHMLRASDKHFRKFGEVYFSLAKPGVVKGWHLQRTAYRYYAVPVGKAKIVLCDQRTNSPTSGAVDEFVLGEGNYRLLIIPPNVWSGFAAVGNGPALIANCTTAPHNPADSQRKDLSDPAIPYKWNAGGG